VEAYELTKDEQSEFDYYDWKKVEEGELSPSFFRYKGSLHDTADFTVTDRTSSLKEWHGYASDSFFSGLVINYSDDCEYVQAGTYYEG
jgi:hypothetical protein